MVLSLTPSCCGHVFNTANTANAAKRIASVGADGRRRGSRRHLRVVEISRLRRRVAGRRRARHARLSSGGPTGTHSADLAAGVEFRLDELLQLAQVCPRAHKRTVHSTQRDRSAHCTATCGTAPPQPQSTSPPHWQQLVGAPTTGRAVASHARTRAHARASTQGHQSTDAPTVKLRMPSASFSVAIASSFSSHRKLASVTSSFASLHASAAASGLSLRSTVPLSNARGR